MTDKEVNLSAKQENTSDRNYMNSTTTTTTSWSKFKDPRIVRVSRAFGGKDRHSKVCTVRGLRDRRVRLSVPTAIQLYDLQDRLGLNQPSKVVDWLLSVAKQEIDGLPPLQFPVLTPNHGFFMPCQSAKQGLKISADFSWSDPSKHGPPAKPTTSSRVFPGDGNDDHDPYSQQNHHSSFSSLLSSATMAPFNNAWDPSSLTLSQPPISQDLDNFTLGSHHLLVTPQPGFQSLDSSSVQPVRPFRFSMTADLLPSQNNDQ